MQRHPLMLQRSYGDLCGIMPQPAYFREQAERYFRIARAKSDRKMAARLEAMAREFLARAEADSPRSQPEAAGIPGWSAQGQAAAREPPRLT
jgi:hypothetical protein